MADQDDRIEAAIRNSLARVDSSSADARQRVYAAAHRSLDRQLESRGAHATDHARMLRDRLSTTIDAIEDGYVSPLLADELNDLTLDLSDMHDAPVADAQTTNSDQSESTSSAPNRPRVIVWAVGLALVAGAVATLAYYVTANDQMPSSTGALAYEASPPFPLVHSETYAAVLNRAAGFVTVSNKTARTDQSGVLPSVALSSEIEEKVSGKTIEVTISARTTAGATAGRLAAIYYTVGVGNSGPRTFPLGAEFSDVTFSYDVPARIGEPGEDYLGVAPVSPDPGASIDVRSIRIDVKPAP
jgi:hypothetical protein